jgi:hypothetical protein
MTPHLSGLRLPSAGVATLENGKLEPLNADGKPGRSSVRVPLENHRSEGSYQNPKVKPKIPITDIPQVQFNSALH